MKQLQARRRPQMAVVTAAIIASFGGAASAYPGDPLGALIEVVPTQADVRFDNARIARNVAGDMVVLWHTQGGGLLARRYAADGAPLGSDLLVDSDPAGPADVAMDDDGDFVVAWADHTAEGLFVRAQRYRADGSANGAPLQVSELMDGGARNAIVQAPSVAMDDDGDFVVAWAQGRVVESGSAYRCGFGIGVCTVVGGYTVRVRRYTGGGAEAQAVQTVDSTASAQLTVLRLSAALGSYAGRVGVAMAPDGRYVVAWSRVSRGIDLLSGVYARRYNANGVGELKRAVSLQRDEGSPAVAMDPYGGYVVAYRDDTRTGGGGIFLRRFPAGPGLGSGEVRVDTGSATFYPPIAAAVAMSPAGHHVVVWHGAPNSTENSYLRAQRYASGGGALGVNFDVAADTPRFGGFNSFDVAMDGDGDFAVVWSTNWREQSPGAASIDKGRVDLQLYEGP